MSVLRSEPFRLSAVLRLVGALVVVSAMCAHLLEGWGEWNDVGRYYAMLASTIGLALGAFAASMWLRDDKGGRVFVGLALLSAVANVTTLGGLLHSEVQWDAAQAQASLFSEWSLGQSASLAAVMSSALLVLLPVIAFAFRVLARARARELTMLFVLLCVLILIPLRASLGAGVVIALASFLPMVYLGRRVRGEPLFGTLEGRFVQAVLFAPALVMFARLQWLYEPNALLMWVLSVTAYVGTRAGARLLRDPLHWLLWIPTLLLACAVGSLSAWLMESVVADVYLLPIFAVVLACLVGDLHRERGQTAFLALGGLIAVSLTVLNALFQDAWAANIVATLIGAALAVFGRWREHRTSLVLGVAGVVMALAPRVWELIEVVDFGHWLTLLVLGIGIIFASTIIERLVKNDRGRPRGDDIAGLVADE